MTVTRFPPSPTGDLHIGGVRTALYNWLLARKHDGKFILRIEDTDTDREKENAVAGIIEGMRWLGLSYDEGPIFQTDRLERYQAVIQQMLEDGSAYLCYCSRKRLNTLRENQIANKEKPRYDGHCRDNPQARADGEADGIKPVIRFKNPSAGDVVWNDLVHGEIRIANRELDDLIICRANGIATYNFCVVVDDIDMRMTHVIRGDDHINNTPRQINIFKALNTSPPAYGHVGMILGSDGKKYSKRHGAASILALRDAGYLPEAVLNYLVRLGWSYGDQEIFSISEMIEKFDITQVNKAASTFDTKKLNWLNQHYMKTAAPAYLLDALSHQYQKLGIDIGSYDLNRIIAHYRGRSKTLKAMAENTTWLFQTPNSYPEKAAKKAFHAQAAKYLSTIRHRIAMLDSWQQNHLHDIVEATADEFGAGFAKVGMPLRLALTGGKPSPGIDETLMLLGKAKTEAAIAKALEHLA